MIRRCTRCGAEFTVREVSQRRCVGCAVEVAALIVADTRRRTRFTFAKALDRSPA